MQFTLPRRSVISSFLSVRLVLGFNELQTLAFPIEPLFFPIGMMNLADNILQLARRKNTRSSWLRICWMLRMDKSRHEFLHSRASHLHLLKVLTMVESCCTHRIWQEVKQSPARCSAIFLKLLKELWMHLTFSRTTTLTYLIGVWTTSWQWLWVAQCTSGMQLQAPLRSSWLLMKKVLLRAFHGLLMANT